MTQCNQETFEFEAHFSRGVTARFDGGTMTSDGGALLLRQTDQRLNLLGRLAACFEDHRNPWLISHSVRELVSQRVYGLALGYEDLNDHDQLREDPLLAVLSGKRRVGEEALAGKSTLNRLELSTQTPSRYKKIHCRQEAIDALWTTVFLEAHGAPPERIVLDLDTTDLPLDGHQEGRFFHGYYDEYCYLPLYIFAGEHLLCARLRTADHDAAAGSKEEVERIVKQIRQAWPEVEIILRADSGFCRDELMQWCEEHNVGYVFGFARNDRLRRLIDPPMREAARLQKESGQPARVFSEFDYQTTTGSWSRMRRVVAKAEQLEGKENPRYVVTNLDAQQWPARKLYEDLYCERGEMENRIKEQLSLFAGRVSAETMRANQLRLDFSAAAYVLLHGLRRIGLQGTELARAQATTIRLRLLKIGAQIRITARKVWLSLASSYPLQPLFRQVWAALRC
ncbi:MAG TPA: IS1380 family transposase [Candidatus Acidoferrales bacterium]|nr:IS1380 family transposase [Candidatus Acidoferrales bacterium]